MKFFIITGGCGFIGVNLIKSLLLQEQTRVVSVTMPSIKVLTRSGVDVAASMSTNLVKSLRVVMPVRKIKNRA